MEATLHIDFKPHDTDISDTLSSAPSMNYGGLDESSPNHANSTSSPENDTKSRRIRKKRDAYRKIDDETRLHLLEAVQRGETLKSAAKRYQVNYSSAKSIFHIYRKEGRILKKATQEKDFGIVPTGGEPEVPTQFMPNHPQPIPNQPIQIPIMPFYQRSIFPQGFQPLDFGRQDHLVGNNDGSGSSSPLNGLVDNFGELLKISNRQGEDMIKPKNFAPINPSKFMPKIVSPTNSLGKMMQPNPLMMQQNHHLMQQNQHIMQPNQQMAQSNQQLISLSNKAPAMSPADRLKQVGDFYMNYSNSPLSGNARMTREGSESGSNRYANGRGEFDSFSDMVSAFQRKKMSGDEDLGWSGGLENAALDTYKTFMDAQMHLSNAFMKANFLNNLVQMKKMDASPSPKFLNFHGN